MSDPLSAGWLLLCGICAFGGELPQVPSGTWSLAGNLAEPREGSTAVLLKDGRVLVTGGGSQPSPTAEFYSGSEGFSPVAPMHEGRSHHISVLLSDGLFSGPV